MKFVKIAALFMFTIGLTLSFGQTYGNDVLVFETPQGETLTLEIRQETEEEIPSFVKSETARPNIEPMDQEALKELLLNLRKPEQEEAVPFCLNK